MQTARDMTDGGEHAREPSKKRGERRKFVKCHPPRRHANHKKKGQQTISEMRMQRSKANDMRREMPGALSKASNEGQPPPPPPQPPMQPLGVKAFVRI